MRSKAKTPIVKTKSAWDHILSLIQDGYLAEAESVVQTEEAIIDELRRDLAESRYNIDAVRSESTWQEMARKQWIKIAKEQKETITAMRLVIEESRYVIERDNLIDVAGDVREGSYHTLNDNIIAVLGRQPAF
jgi:hypothetical protein